MVAISLDQAVKNAIESERSAARFYQLLSENTNDAEAKALLLDLSRQETEHAERISAAGDMLKIKTLPRVSDDFVALVETSPDWAFVDGISLRDALVMALENEEHAALFYSAAADFFEGKTSLFFERLAHMETLHAQILKNKIEHL